MARLVVQIPCWNEAPRLAWVIGDIPAIIEGFSDIRVLVVDDGSTDRTVATARAAGAHVCALPRHEGLGVAFRAGLRAALELGADVIVNTDADGQYVAADIPALVAPILRGAADVVVGVRPLAHLAHYTPGRRAVHALGSHLFARATGLTVPDPVSGFRAYSGAVAGRLDLRETYSHTLETLVVCARKGLRVAAVPVRVARPLRPSHLYRTLPGYLARTAGTLVRASLRSYPE